MKSIIKICVIVLILSGTFNSVQAQEVEDMKAVMIIAKANFRDEELFEPKAVLENAGVKVLIASSIVSPSKGKLGGTANPTLLVRDLKAEDYDAIVFVGGPGSQEYFNSPDAHRVVKEAVALQKILAAICIAPVTLANAGALEAKKATVYPSEEASLKAKGAVYTGADVQVDGNIVTGNGPQAATKFGEAILKLLKDK